MKSFLYLLFLPATLSVSAQAQWVRDYGLKVGVTSSDVRSPDVFDNDPFNESRHRRTGIAAFAFVEWLDASLFSVVTEAGYAQRGFYLEQEHRDAQNNPLGIRKTFYRFDYLSTAALAKLRYDRGGVVPYLVVGPRLDVLLGGEPGGEGSFVDVFAPTAFGSTVGVGAEVDQPLPVRLFFELRYSFDVTNSLPDAPRDIYNNALDVLLGIRL